MTESLSKRYKIGCQDNSCRWGPPGGMATNGGCRCDDRVRKREETARLERRMQVIHGISTIRTLLEGETFAAALDELINTIRDKIHKEIALDNAGEDI